MQISNSSRIILLDSCCLLNLYASRKLEEISKSFIYNFGIVTKVFNESLYVRKGGKGDDANILEPVRLDNLVYHSIKRQVAATKSSFRSGEQTKKSPQKGKLLRCNSIKLYSLEGEEELRVFVNFAYLVDDGEAMTCAIASLRNFSVATDDKKAKKILKDRAQHVKIFSTLDIIKKWVEKNNVTQDPIKRVLIDIKERASYIPGINDTLYEWWEKIIK